MILKASQMINKDMLHFKLYKDNDKDPQAMNDTELINIFREKIGLKK